DASTRSADVSVRLRAPALPPVVPTLELLRRNTGEVARLDAPLAQDLPEGAAILVPARRRQGLFGKDSQRRNPPEAPDQIEVVAYGHVPEPAGLFVHVTAAENALVSE